MVIFNENPELLLEFTTIREQHHSSLQVWMDRHAIDILCLQEVKGTSSRLEGDPSL